MGQTTPIDPLQAAKDIARQHNMFLAPRGSEIRIFRRTQPRPTFLGAFSDPLKLLARVKRCAASE